MKSLPILLLLPFFIIGCNDFWGTIDDGPLPGLGADTVQPGVDTVVDPDLLACPTGEWFYAGEWWCILCSDDGLTYANEGVPVDDAEQCVDSGLPPSPQ